MTFIVLTVALLCLAVGSQRNFVVTAPLNEGPRTLPDYHKALSVPDASVKELESLKHRLGMTEKPLKTSSLNENSANKAEKALHNGVIAGKHSNNKDDVTPGTETIITNSKENKQSLETPIETGNTVDSSEVLYSPLDMAEYVFWTGDEKGVTQTIEEFLQEGLMSREEAISFLQEIKYNLDYLKNHYTQLGLNSRGHSKGQESDAQNYKEKISIQPNEKPSLQNIYDMRQIRQEPEVKREPVLAHPTQYKTGANEKSQDDDYDELLERLRVADFLYTEYSLEEVIYQLAKVMFTQSLTKGSAEAQKALQKFTDFLEMEAEQGHISRALEKRVLDVLIASLSDTLSEHPELLSPPSTSQGSAGTNANDNGQYFLKQMLENVPNDKATLRNAFLAPYADKDGGGMKNKGVRLMDARMKEKKLGIHLPLGLGKYKNP